MLYMYHLINTGTAFFRERSHPTVCPYQMIPFAESSQTVIITSAVLEANKVVSFGAGVTG